MCVCVCVCGGGGGGGRECIGMWCRGDTHDSVCVRTLFTMQSLPHFILTLHPSLPSTPHTLHLPSIPHILPHITPLYPSPSTLTHSSLHPSERSRKRQRVGDMGSVQKVKKFVLLSEHQADNSDSDVVSR